VTKIRKYMIRTFQVKAFNVNRDKNPFKNIKIVSHEK